MTQPPVSCRDACGATAENDDAALAKGWTSLQTTNGWRCGSCSRMLRLAGAMPGRAADTTFVDRLPRTSIGALKRETASSILPVAVRA